MQKRAVLFIGIVVVLLVVVGLMSNHDEKRLSKQRYSKTRYMDPAYVPNTPYRSPGIEQTDEDAREEAAEKDSSRMIGEDMHVALKAYGETSQFGFATISMTQQGLQVDIHTEDSEPPLEVKQPAGIYIGTCEKKGKQQYALTPVLDGKSNTTLNATMEQLRSQGPLTLYIYKGEGDLVSYNSCGELVEK